MVIRYDDDDFVSSHYAFYPSFSCACACASSLSPCGESSLNDGVSYRRPMIVTMTWTMHHYYHCHYCRCRHDDNLAFSISNFVSMNADCCRFQYHRRSPDFDIVSFDRNRDDCDACGPSLTIEWPMVRAMTITILTAILFINSNIVITLHPAFCIKMVWNLGVSRFPPSANLSNIV